MLRFELSLRKTSTTSIEHGVFLTYRGQSVVPTTRKEVASPYEGHEEDGYHGILHDTSDKCADGNSSEDSPQQLEAYTEEAFGSGFIDVGRYGAIPLRSEGMYIPGQQQHDSVLPCCGHR